jgi:Uma2 family endonuclease
VVLSETNVVQPDLIFIATENSGIITAKNIAGAPDLVIEILSPHTAYYDLLEKKDLYATHQVREYWIVDPQKQWIELFVNRDGKFELRQRVEKIGAVSSVVVKGWVIDLSTIFEI